jgi:hypothetical protein
VRRGPDSLLQVRASRAALPHRCLGFLYVTVSPGWYEFPDNPGQVAWWDGTTWDPTTVRPKETAQPQAISAEPSARTLARRTITTQVQVTRRIRPRRVPCGHCSAKLPRFTALAPGVMTCPHCAKRTQVTEGMFFRRGYAVE